MEMLIWEISTLQGLDAGSSEQEIYFHHPSLKLPVRGTGEGRGGSRAQGTDDIEVDTDQESDEAKERQSIELPMEDIVFSNSATTKLAYNGKPLHGKIKARYGTKFLRENSDWLN